MGKKKLKSVKVLEMKGIILLEMEEEDFLILGVTMMISMMIGDLDLILIDILIIIIENN